jgi:hypothetical protein
MRPVPRIAQGENRKIFVEFSGTGDLKIVQSTLEGKNLIKIMFVNKNNDFFSE